MNLAAFLAVLTVLLACLVLSTMAGALLTRCVRVRVAALDPATRHRILLALGATPAALAIGLLLAALGPSLLPWFAPGFDHCLADPGAHGHLCVVHAPHPEVLASLAAAALLGSLALATGFVAAYARVRRTTQIVRDLARVALPDAAQGVSMIASTHPICFTAGLVQPRIFVSTGLVAALSPIELEVVLTHERAHAERGDAWAQQWLSLLSGLHLPSVRGWILREATIAAEEACDEIAATSVGDRLVVASTILAVERVVAASDGWQVSASAAGGVAFLDGAVERRVLTLLAEPRRPTSPHGAMRFASVIAVLLLATATEIHHLAETVVSIAGH